MIHLLLMGAAFYLLLRENPTVRRIDEALDDWEIEDDEDWAESDFRNDLAQHLRNDDHYLIIESGHRRSRHDIWIRDIKSATEVVIEIKLRLDSSSEVKRLIGQIVGYADRAKAMFVVLIDADENMLDELKMSIEELRCKDKIKVVDIIETDDDDDDY
jgi:hypothetical protein